MVNCIKRISEKKYDNFWETVSCFSKFRKYKFKEKKLNIYITAYLPPYSWFLHPWNFKRTKSTFGKYTSSKFPCCTYLHNFLRGHILLMFWLSTIDCLIWVEGICALLYDLCVFFRHCDSCARWLDVCYLSQVLCLSTFSHRLINGWILLKSR